MNFIDLGLPSGTLWADCNVGAEKPQDYGDYFNFDDAQKQGTLPARWQMCELVDCTTQEVCEVQGVEGMRLTGTNGNSIFMPFAGYQFYSNGSLSNVGSDGNWWSCTPDSRRAYLLGLDRKGGVWPTDSFTREYGLSIRLIKNK